MKFSTTQRVPWSLPRLIFFLPKFIRLIFRLLKDPRVPWYLKAVPVLALIYVLSPVDLIPDILMPLVGEIDDGVVLAAALWYFVTRSPRHVLMEHLQVIEGRK